MSNIGGKFHYLSNRFNCFWKFYPSSSFTNLPHCAQLVRRLSFCSCHLEVEWRLGAEKNHLLKVSVESLIVQQKPIIMQDQAWEICIILFHNSANSLLSNFVPVTSFLCVCAWRLVHWRNMGIDAYLPLERGLGAWNEQYSRGGYAHTNAQIFCLLGEDKCWSDMMKKVHHL